MLQRIARRARRVLLDPTTSRLDILDQHVNHLEFWLTSELESIRSEFEARSREQRKHTEAALRACEDSAVQRAQDHSERAVGAAELRTLEGAKRHAEAAVRASETQAGLESVLAHTGEAIAAATASLRREVASVRSALARELRPSGGVDLPTPESTSPAPLIDDLLYLALENRFRGDPSTIEQRQEAYVPFVKDIAGVAHPVLDLGCGRGEWLRVLRRSGVPARGVDSNESCVDECQTDDLDVVVGDLVTTLRNAGASSLGAVTLFQVVEHLPFDVLASVLHECARVLIPGGVLICETPNALNLKVAASTFWLDPTHQRPLHPLLMRFLAEEAGFDEIEDLFVNALGNPPEFHGAEGEAAWLTGFAESIDGPGDYAMVARTPSADHS